LTLHDNQPSHPTTGDASQFQAEVTHDLLLNSTLISLSYTDPINPSHNLAIRIAPELGSNLFSYQVGEYDLIYCDRELLKQRQGTGNFVLWPFPNRVRDKRYSYRGKNYSLANVPRNPADPMLVHGLVYDLAWQHEQPVVKQNEAHVTTFIDISPDTAYYESYPFESRLSLTYTLTNQGASVTYTVQNKGHEPQPFGFALHPYFLLLSGKDDTTVSMPAKTVMEVDDTLLPTTRLLDVQTVMYAMFDLREPRPVGSLKLDHVYTDLTPETHAVINYQKQQMQLLVSTTKDFTHLVIYIPPNDEPFFCLENQTCSTDAINLAARGLSKMAHLLEVDPGQSKSGTISYTISFQEQI
jgi:aldose 1-epimerase